MSWDINEIAIHGLTAGLHNAVARWEAAGAPGANAGDLERFRALAAEENPDPSTAKETYRLLNHRVEQAGMEAAQQARRDAMQREHAAKLRLHGTMVAELRDIRERMGMTQNEMALLLSEKYNFMHNAEADGSMRTERLRNLLDRYRAFEKMHGAQASKAQAKQPHLFT